MLARTHAASGAHAALARLAAAAENDVLRDATSFWTLAKATGLIWLASKHLGIGEKL